MNKTPTSSEHPVSEQYEIRIRGHLEERRANWFEGMTITALANGETLLAGSVVDQAALYSLLRKVQNLGMPLLSVQCVPSS